MDIVWFLLIGAAAGWLAGQFTKGSGFGLIGNLIVGILGAVVGGVLAGILGIGSTHIVGRLLIATGGAIVLLFLLSIAGAKRRR